MSEVTDVYLCFSDEAAADAALLAAGFARDHAPGWAIDRVGVVWTDDDPPTPITGWHVNLRLIGSTLPESLTGYVVTPSSPSRRFA